MENKKERIFKNTFAVNVKSKKILAMKVTYERVHDSKALPGLVDDVIKSDSMTGAAAAVAIGKLFADGAYDGNDIFGYLGDN